MEFYVIRAKGTLSYSEEDELQHHGILGMKWGIRRYQNPDGSLTKAGRERYLRERKKNYEKHKKATSDYYKGLRESKDPEALLNKFVNASPIMQEIVDSTAFNDYVRALGEYRDYRNEAFYNNPKNQEIAREALIAELMKKHDKPREYVEDYYEIDEDLDDYYFSNIDKKYKSAMGNVREKRKALENYSEGLWEKYFGDNTPGFRYDPGLIAEYELAELVLKSKGSERTRNG